MDLWTDPISFKLKEGSYANSNQNMNEPIDINYTWETAPDDEKMLTKQNIGISTTWKRDSDSNQIHIYNRSLVLNNNTFYSHAWWEVSTSGVLQTLKNHLGYLVTDKSSEIK